MRNPSNNPTERIARLCEELAEMEFVLDQWTQAAITWVPMEVMNNLPAKPRLPNLEAEKVRQSLMYNRNRGARNRKAKLAALGVKSVKELVEKAE